MWGKCIEGACLREKKAHPKCVKGWAEEVRGLADSNNYIISLLLR